MRFLGASRLDTVRRMPITTPIIEANLTLDPLEEGIDEHRHPGSKFYS